MLKIRVLQLAFSGMFTVSFVSFVNAQTHHNPLHNLDYGCATTDPYLAVGPNNNFFLYYPEFNSDDCSSGRTRQIKVFKTTDPNLWPNRLYPNAGNTPYPKTVFTLSDLVPEDQAHQNWTKAALWGAGAFYYGKTQKYYLFYSLIETIPDGTADGKPTRSIGLAESDDGDGPFTDDGILIHGNQTDWYYGVTAFVDPKTDKLYIYFANHWKRLLGQEVTVNAQNKLRLTGSHFIVLNSGIPINDDNRDDCNAAHGNSAHHQYWEFCVLEHPRVFHAANAPPGHDYYLLYNGAGGATSDYAVGYAYAGSPTATFTRATEGNTTLPDGGERANPPIGDAGKNPILHRQDEMSFFSPGSPQIFMDSTNHRWMIYRYKNVDQNNWSNRLTSLDPLTLNSGGELAIHPHVGGNLDGPVF